MSHFLSPLTPSTPLLPLVLLNSFTFFSSPQHPSNLTAMFVLCIYDCVSWWLVSMNIFFEISDIWISSLWNVFEMSCHFSIRLSVLFVLTYQEFLYVMVTSPLLIVCVVRVFSQVVTCYFTPGCLLINKIY